MKKPLLFMMVIVLASLSAQAQMKVQSDGHISLGTLSGAWNVGTQVYPSGTVHFNHQSTEDWKWVTVASPNAVKGKCWIVTYPGDKYDHRFFVTGDGYIFKRGSWRAADASLLSSSETIRDAGAVLDSITGVWYMPVEDETKHSEGRKAGVTAQEVEKVLPEAVTADENGLMYVDYETLTVFLIEAVKEQRQEIELLRKTLEENGLLDPQK